jgi:hypothetical protein
MRRYRFFTAIAAMSSAAAIAAVACRNGQRIGRRDRRAGASGLVVPGTAVAAGMPGWVARNRCPSTGASGSEASPRRSPRSTHSQPFSLPAAVSRFRGIPAWQGLAVLEH